MIVSGPVGNPESSSVHRRSLKSINQSPKSKFLGLSLSDESGLNYEQSVNTYSSPYFVRMLLMMRHRISSATFIIPTGVLTKSRDLIRSDVNMLTNNASVCSPSLMHVHTLQMPHTEKPGPRLSSSPLLLL